MHARTGPVLSRAGAVLFGQLPERIASRRCRRSYGIRLAIPWKDSDAISESTTGYPEKFWNVDDKCYYNREPLCCDGCCCNRVQTRGQTILTPCW